MHPDHRLAAQFCSQYRDQIIQCTIRLIALAVCVIGVKMPAMLLDMQRFAVCHFQPQAINTSAGVQAVELEKQQRANPCSLISRAGKPDIETFHFAVAAKGLQA